MLRTTNILFGALVFCALAVDAFAQAHVRRSLYSIAPSRDLQQIVEAVCDPQAKPIPPESLQPAATYFARILPRQYTLDSQNKLLPSAVLSTRPLAFATTPESLAGRPLMQLYMDIGYEAELILSLPHEQEMCAALFRLPTGVTLSKVLDGRLPEDWAKHAYVPTWDNTFALFERIAENAAVEPKGPPKFDPFRTFFRTEKERAFVLSFPDEGKERIKKVPYYGLKALGGSDWTYRRLLEAKLSAMEHFRGDGRTHNEVLSPNEDDSQPMLYEYLVPNVDLNTLPELVVISLGTLGDSQVREPPSQ